jgi:hypothetical protein
MVLLRAVYQQPTGQFAAFIFQTVSLRDSNLDTVNGGQKVTRMTIEQRSFDVRQLFFVGADWSEASVFLPIESGLPFSTLGMNLADRGFGLFLERNRALEQLVEVGVL